MKKERLSDEIGKIDEDIVDEAAKKREQAAGKDAPRKKSPLLIVTSVLVAAAAAVSGVVFIPKFLSNNGIDTAVPDQPAAITTTAATTPAETAAGAANESETGSRRKNTFSRERRRSDIVADVSAVTASDDSISPDSSLRIRLAADVSEETLRDRIKLSPESEFTLTRDNDRTYILKANKSFGNGTLVKLAVSDDDGDVCDSWAFRTADKFEVTSRYPAGESVYASTDTGVEIGFTMPPSLDAAKDYFSISPAIKGRFSSNETTLYYIPTDGFQPNVRYTVTLKAGFPAENGETLDEDCVFSFRTSSYTDRGSFMFTSSSNSGFSETFLPDDNACIEIYCSGNLAGREFETHLYRFGGSDDYKNAVVTMIGGGSAEDYTVDTSNLTEVFTSDEVPFSRENSNSRVYVLLPDDLEPGYYIADVSVKDVSSMSLQYLIQVSPLSVYGMSLGDENVFFVNDTKTGLPAKGADVTLEKDGKKYSGKVGDDGLAYIRTGGESGRAVLTVGTQSGEYIDSFDLSDAENVNYDDKYYMYLYTDRAAYLVSDTINVWGVLLPKAKGGALPDDLKLSFDGEAKPLSVAADGTFKSTFTYKDHTEGWWNAISLMSGSDIMLETHVQIHDYVKPTYVMDIDAPSFVVQPHKNEIPVTITASYYEGTPAEGLMIKNDGDYKCDPEILRTDGVGEAKAKILAQDVPNSYKAQNLWVCFQLTGVEDTYTTAYKTIPALYHDVMLEYDYDYDTRSLTLTASKLDLTKAEAFFDTVSNDGWYVSGGNMDILKNGAADIPVTVEITRHSTEKQETGSYYDYIEKRTVKTYKYNYRQDNVGTYKIKTTGGKYTLTGLPTDPSLGRYDIRFYYEDSDGYSMEDILWVGDNDDSFLVIDADGNYIWYDGTTDYKVFRLDAETANGLADSGYASYSAFRENEEITFRLACANKEEKLGGKLFVAVYNSDIITRDVYDINELGSVKYKTSRAMIPNAGYTGAYFDGKHVYGLSGGVVIYDESERGIQLTASADEKTYDAGETAVITVNARGLDGAAVEGATVLLNVTDEAAYAIAEQNADPLGEIYRYIYYPRPYTYVSYIQHLPLNASAGEKGGGGPSEVRRDFRDNAYFDSAVTDKDGNATFTVKMPDNMTTWRGTFLAVSQEADGDVLAGKKLLPIVVTRPLFISPIMHQTIVEGDDAAVSAKCAGLPNDGKITVNISGNGVDKTLTIKQQETANFGKLGKGEYKVLFTAEKDGERDAVELPLTVTDTLLETRITRSAMLDELSSAVKPTKYPFGAAFFNKEYMFRADIVYDLIRYCGENLESRMAADFAATELGFMTEEEFIDLYSNETASGYARLLPAAEPSADLTALMAVLCPKTVSGHAREKFTIDAGSDNLGNVSAAYMGLAALGEPVMNDVKKILAETDTDKLYLPNGLKLTAALALCGDYDSAYKSYIRLVPELTINDSDPDAPYAYLLGDNGKPNGYYTRTALIVASLLDLPEAEYFARYLLTEDPKYSSCAAELAIFVKSYVPRKGGEAVFTYMRGGEKQTVTIDRYRPTYITFTEEQLRTADFETKSGEVYVIAYYTGRVDENTDAPTIKVTKKLSGTLAAGEEIIVTIYAPKDCIVYDVIPSCGRRSDSVNNQLGQLVRLYVHEDGIATYKFTPSTQGEYVVESAVVYDYGSGTWGIGERSSVTIGNGNEGL